jgi:hypothetical protein
LGGGEGSRVREIGGLGRADDTIAATFSISITIKITAAMRITGYLTLIVTISIAVNIFIKQHDRSISSADITAKSLVNTSSQSEQRPHKTRQIQPNSR